MLCDSAISFVCLFVCFFWGGGVPSVPIICTEITLKVEFISHICTVQTHLVSTCIGFDIDSMKRPEHSSMNCNFTY